ncbi:S1 family peptidase [Ekhidna sp.]|uniref:S1 family peptidase n=1 Tax=Ekhidna sp. TaxID=2608089 RepID=UPI003BAA1D56
MRMLFLSLICFTLQSSLIAQPSSFHPSVIQIEVDGTPRGVGVVVGGKDQVVTALHVVAGLPNISVYSKYLGKAVGAEIVKVHKESDLALLELKSPLNLPYVGLSSQTPRSDLNYYIYGYTATPEIIDLPMGLASNFFKLTSIIAPGTTPYNLLLSNQYPQPQATIVRLGDPIKHGDSGSPILDADGRLIAIADGGLRQGVQRLNWGISAQYVNSLFSSKESIALGRSRAPFLKNARAENKIIGNGNHDQEIHYIFSDYLKNIYKTALSNHQEIIDQYRQYGKNASGQDIFEIMVDVYEDYYSGATFAIPREMPFDYDPDDGFLTAYSPSENVTLDILVDHDDSFEGAIDSKVYFFETIKEDMTWYLRKTGNYTSRDYNYYQEDFNLTRFDEYQDEISSMIGKILVEDNFIMASAVTVYDLEYANDEAMDWYYTYAAEACLVLSGFALH